MATHRYTLLLEEKLTRANTDLLRMSRSDLHDEAKVQALLDRHRVIPPVLSFDPNRKSYLDNGTCRLAIPVIQGEVYPLEDLLEESYYHRGLPPYALEIRPASREIWVEFNRIRVTATDLQQFPRQIFDHLNTIVEQVIVPEVQRVNTLLQQKLYDYLRDREA